MTIWRVEVYRGEERRILVQADSLMKVANALFACACDFLVNGGDDQTERDKVKDAVIKALEKEAERIGYLSVEDMRRVIGTIPAELQP